MAESSPHPTYDVMADVGNDRRQVDAWRRLYESNASASSWLSIHRWPYDESVVDAVAADLRHKLELTPTDRVAEIGCGTGAMLSRLLYPGQPGVGFDLCEAMVRRVGDFVDDPSCLRLGVAEADRQPLRSASFDKVFAYSVFQCFPSRAYAQRVLAEAVRLCVPGGIVLIGDIFGAVEKQRQYLLRRFVPRWIVESLLWPAAPIWHLNYVLRRPSDGVRRRPYSRGFFHRALACKNCKIEFLWQEIPRRAVSALRYDVRIWKTGPARSSGVRG